MTTVCTSWMVISALYNNVATHQWCYNIGNCSNRWQMWYFIMSVLPWGARETSRFTVGSHDLNVSASINVCLHLSVCARPCLHDILQQFFPDGFQILRYGALDKTLNCVTFCDLVSIIKVTGSHYVSKLTLFTQCCLYFCHDGFQIKTLGKHSQDIEFD